MGQDPLPVFVFGCLSCGKTVAGNEKNCPRCGVSFEDVLFECPFCGELVSPRQSRCKSCGTEFSAFAEGVSETCSMELDGSARPLQGSAPKPEQTVEPVEYECPNCGKPVSENDASCPHCGAIFG